ncbi:MAG: translocation/assembly module TamB domain-containing protein [Alphaproteobacteria bacterium]|nr:translocation/assembly module TamB domain-containing protein [Alphaproteobacteria bacterium]
MARLARALRWLLRTALRLVWWLCVALLLALVVLDGALRTSWGREVLRSQVEALLDGLVAPGRDVRIGGLSLTLDLVVQVRDFAFVDPEGEPIIAVGSLDLRMAWWPLLRGELHGDTLRIERVVVDLDSDEEGVLDLVRLFGGPSTEPVDPDAPPWAGLPFDIVVDQLRLTDGRVSLWGFAPPGERPGGFEAKVLTLASGRVRLPRRTAPRVEVADVHLRGVLLDPGPAGLMLDGQDVVWTGDGVIAHGTAVQALGTRLGLDGHVADLFGVGDVDLTVGVMPLDLGAIDAVFGAGTDGVFAGELKASGSLAVLELEGALAGQPPTRGGLRFTHATVCLPRPVEAPAGCGAEGPTVPAGSPLRWEADLGLDDLAIEEILPSLGGPLQLRGRVQARGGGTAWPDGVFVDRGRLDLGPVDVWGVPLRRIGAGVTLSRGRLRIRDLDATAVVGRVRGEGTFDLLKGRLEADLEGDLRPELLADLGVTQLSGGGSFAARVRGDVFAPGAPIEVLGTVHAEPLAWDGDDVTVERADASFGVRVEHGVTDVLAQVTAQGVQAYGFEAPDAELPRLTVHVEGSDVQVGGQVLVPELTGLDGQVHAVEVDAGFEVAVPREGELSVDAEVALGAHELAGLMGSHGTVDVALRGSQLEVGTDLRWEQDPFVVVPSLHMDLDTQEIDVPEALFAPTWRQRWSLERPLHLRLVDGGVADADLALSSELGRLEVVGRLGTQGPLAGRVQADGLDLDALAELFPDQLSGLDGVVRASLDLRGDAARPQALLDVDAEDLFLDGVLRWLGVHGQVELADDLVRVDLRSDVADRPLLRAKGTAPVHSDLAAPALSTDGEADLVVVVEPGDLDRFGLAFPGAEGALPEGRLSGQLAVQGDLRDPDLDLQAVAEVLVDGLRVPLRTELDVRREEGVLTAVVDAFDGLDPVMRLDGSARTRMGEIMDWLLEGAPAPSFDDPSLFADDLDLRADLDRLQLGTLREALGLDVSVDGTVDGTVQITGSPDRPLVRADVHGDLDLAGRPGALDLQLAPQGDSYDVDLRLGDADGTWLTAEGILPVEVDLTRSPETWGTGDLAIRFGGDGVPLQALAALDPGLEVEEGRVQLLGALGGSLDDPEPNAQVRLDGARFAYRPLGLAVRELDVALDVVPTGRPEPGDLRLDVRRLFAKTRPLRASLERVTQVGESTITGEGSVSFVHWAPEQVDLGLHLDSAWLAARDTLSARASGDLTATGTWPALKVRGTVAADQGAFELNVAELTAERALQLDPRIVVTRGATSSEVRVTDALPGFLDELDVDVDVDLGRNVNLLLTVPLLDELGAVGANLTRADITARMGGQVKVGVEAGRVTAVGDVELLAGRVKILRGDFGIDAGSRISFIGDVATPLLDVGGAMSVTGGELRIRVTGSALAPEVEFTSDDFGGDTAILTILFTGRSPDELSADQGRAAIEAVGTLLFQGLLGGTGGLGSFSVGPDGSVTFGLPVYRTVFLQSHFDPTPELQKNTITIRAEWSILPRLVLSAAYGDQLVFGDLYYELRLTSLCDPARARYEKAFGVTTTAHLGCMQIWRAMGRRERLDEE